MQPKSRIRQSRCNPQSSTSILIPKIPFQKHEKSFQPQPPTPKPSTNKDTLQTRYLSLQQMYNNLQQKLQQRMPSITEQDKQLQQLRIIHENKKRQITKLRGMLGFLDKITQATQTNNPSQFNNVIDLKNPSLAKMKNTPNFEKTQNSYYRKNSVNKLQKKNHSNLQNLFTQPQASNTLYHKHSLKNITTKFREMDQINTSYKKLINNQSDIEFNTLGTTTKKQPKLSYSIEKKDKYKFVPSLYIC